MGEGFDVPFDEQPRHDCLSGAGIIGKKEAQGLPEQHHLVDG